jgi:hypothetical protein
MRRIFFSFFVALGFSRLDGESTLPLTAANANRSADDHSSVGAIISTLLAQIEVWISMWR